MENCDLAFERSEVTASINSSIDSVKNPYCGRIEAYFIDEIILEKGLVDPSKTSIVAR